MVDCGQWINHHTKSEQLNVAWFVGILLHCFHWFSSLGTDFSVMDVLFQRIPHILCLQNPGERDV